MFRVLFWELIVIGRDREISKKYRKNVAGVMFE